MICPKCHSKMKVTHSYTVDHGRSQRLLCKCGLSGTAVTVMVALDPVVGEGVDAYTKKLAELKTPPSLVFTEESGADKSSEPEAIPGQRMLARDRSKR